MRKRILILLCSLLILISLSITAFADFGDFGGDSDYGGGGYDGGGYDSGDYDYDYDNDRDYERKVPTTTYYEYYGWSFDSDDAGFGGIYNCDGKKISPSFISSNYIDEPNYGIIVIAFIITVFLIVIVSSKVRVDKNRHRGSSSKPAGATPTDARTLKSMSSYKSVDPEFSEEELKEKISNIYVQMQNCWQNKNIDTLRPYFTDTLFAQFDRQLDSYRRNKQTNYVEKIAVLDVNLKGWKQEGENDTIIATVRTRIIDYVVDDNTGKIIRGSNNKEKFMTYEWALTRKTGVKTVNDSSTRVVHCPNCGASVNINKSAKCEYCGSIITVDSTDWTINGIKGISQQTR